MQGILGRSHSALLQALSNTADGSLQLARRVKINEIKSIIILLYHMGIILLITYFAKPVCYHYKNCFSLIFMQYLDDKLLSHPINHIIYFICCQVLANMVFMRYINKTI